MKNSEITKGVVDYILTVAGKKYRSYRDFAFNYTQKYQKISDKTIENMPDNLSAIRLNTLLNMCEMLELDLSSVLRAVKLGKIEESSEKQRLVYNVHHNAYKGYMGSYHVFFLSTQAVPDAEKPMKMYDNSNGDAVLKNLVHGILTFDEINKTGECTASLILDADDVQKDGKPFKKYYEGTLVYSTNGFMFCNLVSNELGDMVFLVFEHSALNNKDRACVVGCAATSSSGLHRHPVIHRFCLCSAEQYPVIDEDKQRKIQGLLRLHNENIFLSNEKIEKLENDETLNETFRKNLSNHMNIVNPYFRLPVNVLKNDIPPLEWAPVISKICELSAMETAFWNRSSDEEELTNLLYDAHVNPRAKVNEANPQEITGQQ